MNQPQQTVHDVVGIGIGPFNLGLACLTDPIEDLDAVFLDQRDGFAWHHGMMLERATIQVPFLADLVSMADPTSRFSFLNWLKQTGRLYPFYIREDFHPLRREYDAYCRWAAEQLDTLRWGRHVESVEYDAAEDLFTVTATVHGGETETYLARDVVLGVGTGPRIPEALRNLDGPVRHTSEYVGAREEICRSGSVAVIGSGQSAAEVYLDLLEGQEDHGCRIDWITRSPRFFPMEDTKLTLEMTSPEYTRHFHGLPEALRDRLGREQRSLYKGISMNTIEEIHEELYRGSFERRLRTTLLTNTEVTSAEWDPVTQEFHLGLHHSELQTDGELDVDQLVLATGYAPRDTPFLEPLEEWISRDAAGRFDVGLEYHVDTLGGRVFVQNGEEHTHGLVAPDLGMGAWRNAIIIRRLTGREVYPIEENVAYQDFGLGPAGKGADRHRPAGPAIGGPDTVFATPAAHDPTSRPHDTEEAAR